MAPKKSICPQKPKGSENVPKRRGKITKQSETVLPQGALPLEPTPITHRSHLVFPFCLVLLRRSAERSTLERESSPGIDVPLSRLWEMTWNNYKEEYIYIYV